MKKCVEVDSVFRDYQNSIFLSAPSFRLDLRRCAVCMLCAPLGLKLDLNVGIRMKFTISISVKDKESGILSDSSSVRSRTESIIFFFYNQEELTSLTAEQLYHEHDDAP